MKRILDLEREILLFVEADEHSPTKFMDLSGLAGHSDQQIAYQVEILGEAGFLIVSDHRTHGNPYAFVPRRLTMMGHEYLDTIRDPDTWEQTKNGAQRVGAFSIEVISAIAKGFISKKIKDHTGLEVDL